MDLASAAKLVSALDQELARRQKRRDDAEEARWREECDSIEVFACIVDRLTRRLEEPSAGPLPPWYVAMSEDERTIHQRRIEELGEQIGELADRLERKLRHEEDVRNGIVRRSVRVAGGPRSPHLLGKEPKPNGENGKSTKLSRTEQAQAKAEEELQARMALVRQAQPGQPGQSEGLWRLGSVVRFNLRDMSGVVSFGGVEVSVGPAAFCKSGLLTLSPRQPVECLVTECPDGALTVIEIKLSVTERAAAIAELERQAQAAEENYRIELMRRGLH